MKFDKSLLVDISNFCVWETYFKKGLFGCKWPKNCNSLFEIVLSYFFQKKIFFKCENNFFSVILTFIIKIKKYSKHRQAFFQQASDTDKYYNARFSFL